MSLARAYPDAYGSENHAMFVFEDDNPKRRWAFAPIVEFGPSAAPLVARTTWKCAGVSVPCPAARSVAVAGVPLTVQPVGNPARRICAWCSLDPVSMTTADR